MGEIYNLASSGPSSNNNQLPPGIRANGEEKFLGFGEEAALTAGSVEWWKARVADFPNLAPLARAFLLFPRSSALTERTFSFLGHAQAMRCRTATTCLRVSLAALPAPFKRMTA